MKSTIFHQPQLGSDDHVTSIKVLAGPNTKYTDVSNNRMKHKSPKLYRKRCWRWFPCARNCQGDISKTRLSEIR